jgi:hypothetical protein
MKRAPTTGFWATTSVLGRSSVVVREGDEAVLGGGLDQLRRYPDAIPADELIRFFTLMPGDVAFVNGHRGETSRMGVRCVHRGQPARSAPGLARRYW